MPVKSWPLAHEFEGYERNEKCLESLQPERLKKIQRPFVLCVGTIEVRKNGVALLKVWQRLLKELGDKTPQLVFAGKYGWKIEAFKKLLQEDLSLQQAVTIIPQATDADLAVLYQNCLFFVYPSLVEGWGLPIGEAAWFGKYSVVSSSSSLPEVCGDLVDYVDPININECTQSIKRAVLDHDYRKHHENNIAAASLRSWKDVAVHLKHLLDH
jgi:glycosyltransferase involved in cell wall biosynthesis